MLGCKSSISLFLLLKNINPCDRAEGRHKKRYDCTGLLLNTYIAAYIQVLYKGDAVHPTGLTVNQGCRQLSTGLINGPWVSLRNNSDNGDRGGGYDHSSLRPRERSKPESCSTNLDS